MRVLIVLPQQQAETGNFVTARRLQNGLQALDIDVELLPIKLDESSAITTAINRFKPDQLLLLHGWRCGFPWLNCVEASSILTTVLLTGTDINHDIMDKERGPTVELVLKKAAAIISQNRLTYEAILNQSPDWIKRLHYIPPGVFLGRTPYPLRQKHNISKEAILFLHPAGIRPVKANLELLKLCDPLALSHKNFMIAFCGPPLDPDYFNKFKAAIAQRPWSRYLGIIPAAAMPSAMAEADLILNHSHSEGMSNALLEAVAIGRPILARNITGNADVIKQQKLGTLYDDDTDFLNQATLFLSSNPVKPETGQYGNFFSPKKEALALATLLESMSDEPFSSTTCK